MLVQVRCMVCGKHTIGSAFVLDIPDGTSRYGAEVEARFGPFIDCANLDAR